MPLVEVPKAFSGQSFQHDPATDRQALEALLPDLQKFSPLVGIDSTDPTRDNSDSIFLDISRTYSVLGGLPRVLEDLKIHFQQLGYSIQLQTAETLAAAWALAHFGSTKKPSPSSTPEKAIRDLPVVSLQIDAQTQTTFQELGIQSVQQVLDLPRASLPSRFGDQLNRRINQILGLADERILVFHPETQRQWTHRLEHPSGDAEVLQTIACLLLRQAIDSLRPQQLGILSLYCQFRTENQSIDFRLKLVEPTLDQNYLMQLLILQMEQQQIHQPQTAVHLFVPIVGENRPQQQWLFQDQHDNRRKERAGLVERLAARLGDTAIQQLRQQSQALPERNYVQRKRMTLQQPVKQTPKTNSRSPSQNSAPAGSLERPSRLFAQPKRLKILGPQRCSVAAGNNQASQQRIQGAWVPQDFQLGKRSYKIVFAVGPERIESQWWEGRWVRRDYFRVHTEQGQRFWIFREARNHNWYVHGDFA